MEAIFKREVFGLIKRQYPSAGYGGGSMTKMAQRNATKAALWASTENEWVMEFDRWIFFLVIFK
jgi:hypothetical protein